MSPSRTFFEQVVLASAPSALRSVSGVVASGKRAQPACQKPPHHSPSEQDEQELLERIQG